MAGRRSTGSPTGELYLSLWRTPQSSYPIVYVNNLPDGSKANIRRTRGTLEVRPPGSAAEVERAIMARYGVGTLEELGMAGLVRLCEEDKARYEAAVPERERAVRGALLRAKALEAGRWTAADAKRMHAEEMAHPLPEPVTLYVDHREPRTMLDLLRRVPNLVVEEASLETADYVLPGKLVIERKDDRDLVGSMVGEDARFHRQIETMCREDGVKILILEGDWREGRMLGLERITSVIAGAIALSGISVVQTLAPEQTVYLIAKMVRYASFGLGYDPGLRGGAPESPERGAQFVLQGLPGVSAKLAKALKEHFGSVRAVACASVREIAQVPGIGAGKAVRIFDVMNNGDRDLPVDTPEARRSKIRSTRLARLYLPVSKTDLPMVRRKGCAPGQRWRSDLAATLERSDGIVIAIPFRRFDAGRLVENGDGTWTVDEAVAVADGDVERYRAGTLVPLPIDRPIERSAAAGETGTDGTGAGPHEPGVSP